MKKFAQRETVFHLTETTNLRNNLKKKQKKALVEINYSVEK